MMLGVVRGTIVSTIHHPFYGGRKLLVVGVTEPDFSPTKKYVIAVDAAGAGVGQRVLVLDEGNGARQILGDDAAPVRSVVVGIVDEVSGASAAT
jgi:microcompartment protein CcmK/EutM